MIDIRDIKHVTEINYIGPYTIQETDGNGYSYSYINSETFLINGPTKDNENVLGERPTA